MSDLFDILRLSAVRGIGQFRLRMLIAHFGSAGKVFNSSIEEICKIGNINRKIAQTVINQKNNDFAEKQLNKAQKLNIKILSLWDEEYPRLLKTIYDPPCLLFIRGDLEAAAKSCFAVVGMRACSQYGQVVARRFGEDLARAGITVVSGMARGIDTYSHIGALAGGGPTIAVLGCGPDVIYPPENVKLYKQIMDNGCIISEFPLSTQPKGGFFPRRNRIISGLSAGILVVEAGLKSGALITAYMALDQGREVFAVPGSIQSMKSRGAHRLLRQGARLVESIADIQAELPQLGGKTQSKQCKLELMPELSSEEQTVWEKLGFEPIHIDPLAVACDKSVSEVLALLLAMELKGCVNQLMGKMFTRQV